ncbi:MAG: hypothetical protein JWO86_5511 [Myxococcaceae bacterium]|nr:hypothetical protein [Myxococcaceae bacterium]
MASRVLSRAHVRIVARALHVAALAAGAVVLGGCPHDWATYESVSTDDPHDATTGASEGGSAAETGANVDGDSGGTPSSDPLFATFPEKPLFIEADAQGIVLATTGGSVVSCDHHDCTASMRSIASMQHDIRALAIGDDFVAWAARGDHAARRSSRSTPGPAQEANENDGLVAIAVTATRMYWAVDAVDSPIASPGVRSCRPGIDCTNLVFGSFADGRVSELRFDGPDAFWLGEAGLSGCPIASCDADTKNSVILSADPVSPSALAVDADSVYYASALEGGSLRAVSRLAIAGGAALPRTLAKNLGTITRLAASTTSVWMTRSAAGTLSKVPRGGGAVVDVATKLESPMGIARGGGYMYVACNGDGRVLRWKED